MPPQDAPDQAPARAAISPPLLPIPPYRIRSFTEGVGERLRNGAANGIAEAQTLALIARERNALAAAIDQPNFRDAFALAYEKGHNELMPAAPVSAQQARAATDEIIDHRINDARQLAQLVNDETFVARARVAQPKPATYQLPPEKMTEMVARFAADGSSYGIDARVHNQQAMEGHRIGHLALARIYEENGPLMAPLVQNLTAQLPGMDAQQIRQLAGDWLEARRTPALATATELGEQGSVYQQVMQRTATTPQAVPATRILASTAQASLGASLPLALQTTTALTPRDIERSKNTKERASEWAYTMNHALSCGTTDIFIQPYVGKWVTDAVHNNTMPKGFRWLHNIFEKHDHGTDHHHHDEHCGHGHAEPHAHDPNLRNNAAHWFGGEVMGDVGAIPLTVAVQRFAPGLMHGIRTVLEPLVGNVFRHGAERDARRWAVRQGEVPDHQAIVNKAEELYDYEMEHLPQAVVWNAFSVPINVATQMRMGSSLKWPTILLGKVFGSVVSNSMLIGGRAMVPDTFHRWDTFNSEKIVVPITKAVGGIFGADTSDVDDIARRQREHDSHGRWSARVAADGAEIQPAR